MSGENVGFSERAERVRAYDAWKRQGCPRPWFNRRVFLRRVRFFNLFVFILLAFGLTAYGRLVISGLQGAQRKAGFLVATGRPTAIWTITPTSTITSTSTPTPATSIRFLPCSHFLSLSLCVRPTPVVLPCSYFLDSSLCGTR